MSAAQASHIDVKIDANFTDTLPSVGLCVMGLRLIVGPGPADRMPSIGEILT